MCVLGRYLIWKITKQYGRGNKNNRIVGNVFSHKRQENKLYFKDDLEDY